MGAVVAEFPAQFFFGQFDRGQVAGFVGVFSEVAHRVFDAFDLTTRVVGEDQVAAGSVGRFFELFFGVVGERDRVFVAVGLFGQLAGAVEGQFELIGRRDVVGAFLASFAWTHGAAWYLPSSR